MGQYGGRTLGTSLRAPFACRLWFDPKAVRGHHGNHRCQHSIQSLESISPYFLHSQNDPICSVTSVGGQCLTESGYNHHHDFAGQC